jgi:hypothetical protein
VRLEPTSGSEQLPPDPDELQPEPAALLESLRGIGYSFDDAVCDIVDNSISVGASQVAIFIQLIEPGGIVVDIADNGPGLDEVTLRVALTLGARDRSPKTDRRIEDLGRFGLGLKTASFAMAKRLSLFTRHEHFTGGRAWDLEEVADSGKWRVGSLPESEVAQMNERIAGFPSGSVVRWSKIDRLPAQLGNNKTASLAVLAENLRRHLGLIYHRFIEGIDAEGTQRIAVAFTVNGVAVSGWNPLAPLVDRPELVDMGEVRRAHGVRAEYAVLPPEAMLTHDERRQACPAGRRLSDMQGFYVYRGDRLVCFGTWLGLPGGTGGRWSREPSTQLARVAVDISNASDEDWSLDVRKSKVTPPERDRLTLSEVGAEARARSRQRIFGRQGGRQQQGSTGALPPLWVMEEGLLRINRGHPLVAAISSKDASGCLRSSVLSLLRQLEDNPALIAMVTERRAESRPQTPSVNVIDETDFDEVVALASTLTMAGTALSTVLDVVAADPRFRAPEIRERLTQKLKGLK